MKTHNALLPGWCNLALYVCTMAKLVSEKFEHSYQTEFFPLSRNGFWIVPVRKEGASVPEAWRVTYMYCAIWVIMQLYVTNVASCLLSGKWKISPALMFLPVSYIPFDGTSK
jgi:hypothetical protein